ncbi:MAG: glycosyltransferase family 39 protein [Euryarchaeota archaeon]|nr:glycosyltransferase family 39 protein [Euryarchaeota archaeon]
MNPIKLRTLYRYVFSDDTSTLFFFASLTFCLALWNLNIFINDEVTLAAQLINLGHGVLSLETTPTRLYEGLSFGGSGPMLAFTYQGHVYAFYTHALAVFAAPFYGLLYIISATVGIRLFFASLWSFSIFMVSWLLGKRWGKPRLGRDLGAFVALGLLIINIYVATKLPPLVFDQWGALMAIQLFNILATSAIVLFSLSIFRRYFANGRIAAFGAAYILVATPVTFWAVSAKDHTASVLLIVASIWSLYIYLLDGKTRYRYLSYILVGISFWVRVFDAIPLLIAIVLTDLLTSEGRIKALITAAVTVTLGMVPYFINNFLLFGNPFLSPVYLSAHQEIAQQTSSAAASTSSALFATIQRLPTLFFSTWDVQSSANWPQHLYHVLFYVNMPVTLSIFQICPLLIVPLFAALPYVVQKLSSFKRGAVRLKIEKKRAIAVTFFVCIVAHLIIYAPFQEQGFGLDMRYFLPLYIPLLFFTLASIRDVLMFEGRIERAFAAAWIIFAGLVLVYIALFALKTSNLISSLSFPFIGTLGVITAALMVLFVPYFVGYRKGVKELAILVGFATFVSSYWLIFASLVWQKTPIGVPRPGMILPIMEVIHRVIMVAIGS